MMTKKFFNVKEAAEVLQCSERNVYELTRTRKLRFYRPAKRILFAETDILAFIESSAQEVQPQMTTDYETELINSMI